MKLDPARVEAAYNRAQETVRRNFRSVIVLLGFLLVSFFLIFGIATLGIQRDQQRWLPLNLAPHISADYQVDAFSQSQRLARINPDILEEVRRDALPTPTPATPEIGTPTPTPTITLTPEPADLRVDIGGPYVGQEGRPIALVATSPGLTGLIPGTIAYAWDLDGNGRFDDDEGAEILAVYPNDDVYQISVQVSDLLGRVATDTTTVTVENVAPLVRLGPDQQKNEGEPFQFTATVEDPGSDLLIFHWDFGDGTTSTINTLTPGHTYLDNGDYTISLRVEDNDGGVGEDSLLVQVLNLPPLADAGPDHDVVEGSSVTFRGNGSDPAGEADPLIYAWDLNYDGFNFDADLTGQTVSAFYEDGSQSFVVALRVEDGDGGQAIDTTTVNVGNEPPQILAVTTSDPKEEGTAISIQVSATDVGSDTLTYAFDWENDGRYEEVNESGSASNTWENDGSYTVGLLVDDGDDGQTFSTVDLTVGNLPPLAVATGPSGAVFEGSSLNFSGAGSTDPGIADVLTYRWNFSDGSTTTGREVSHTFADNGVYSTTLTVTDDAGASSVARLAVTVDNANPLVTAGPDLTVDEGNNVTTNFSATATDPGSADVLTYAWDFNGDDVYDEATGSNPVFNFPLDGPRVFTVAVRVRDDDYLADRGEPGQAIDRLRVTVNNTNPQIVNLNVPQTPNQGQSVTLSANATDIASDALTYQWDVDYDGSNFNADLTGQSVSYAWNNPGVYQVRLRVQDDDYPSAIGEPGEAFASATVTVNGRPTAVIASIPPVDESKPTNPTIHFDGSGSSDPDGDVLTYTWTFGDGNTFGPTTSTTVSHVYAKAGTYIAQLQVNDGDIDSDIASTVVTVNNLRPTAVIAFSTTPSGPPYYEPTTFLFNGDSSSDPGPLPIASYEWDFGDGKTDTGSTTNNTFADSGTYTVTLRVRDSGDPVLVHTESVRVSIQNRPPTATLNISPTKTSYDEGESVTLDASASYDQANLSGPIYDPLTYTVSINDGVTTTRIVTGTSNPLIPYTFLDGDAMRSEGTVYTITVEVGDGDGGIGTDVITVTVRDVPPTVSAGGPYNTPISSTINLSATGSDVPADLPLTYDWDFDNDGFDDGTGSTVPFSSTITGTFTVQVRATASDGGTATDSTTVTVNSVLPLALLGGAYGWLRRKRRHQRLRQHE